MFRLLGKVKRFNCSWMTYTETSFTEPKFNNLMLKFCQPSMNLLIMHWLVTVNLPTITKSWSFIPSTTMEQYYCYGLGRHGQTKEGYELDTSPSLIMQSVKELSAVIDIMEMQTMNSAVPLGCSCWISYLPWPISLQPLIAWLYMACHSHLRGEIVRVFHIVLNKLHWLDHIGAQNLHPSISYIVDAPCLSATYSRTQIICWGFHSSLGHQLRSKLSEGYLMGCLCSCSTKSDV